MPETTGPKQGRTTSGRFAKGTTGNANGRPRGVRNRATVMAEMMMESDTKNVVQAVLNAATAGDMQAARLVLDRIAPVRRGRSVELDLPRITTAADAAIAQTTVTALVAAGTITPEEGAAVAGLIEQNRRSIELAELERRLAELERRMRPQ